MCLPSIGTGWGATDDVPVLVSIGPELDNERFHTRELDVCIAGSGVEFVAVGVLVSVIVADERQILQCPEVQCVLSAGRVDICIGRLSDDDVLDEPGFDVGVAVREFLAHPSPVGLGPNTIRVLGLYPTTTRMLLR